MQLGVIGGVQRLRQVGRNDPPVPRVEAELAAVMRTKKSNIKDPGRAKIESFCSASADFDMLGAEADFDGRSGFSRVSDCGRNRKPMHTGRRCDIDPLSRPPADRPGHEVGLAHERRREAVVGP